MKRRFKFLLITVALLIFCIPYVTSHAASKNAHQAKNKQQEKYKRKVKKKKSDKLVILNVMPESGKSREAGFDGTFIMETTTLLDSDFSRCAKASRGLIMLDNAMLKKCGGRAEGWSTGPGVVKKVDHSKHKM